LAHGGVRDPHARWRDHEADLAALIRIARPTTRGIDHRHPPWIGCELRRCKHRAGGDPGRRPMPGGAAVPTMSGGMDGLSASALADLTGTTAAEVRRLAATVQHQDDPARPAQLLEARRP
jgi:hypothetical protein